jgi:hypothetical protein
MSTIIFDTLKFANRLNFRQRCRKLDLSWLPVYRQAEAEAEALAEALELTMLENRLEARLIKWQVGIMVAMTGIFAAIVKLT